MRRSLAMALHAALLLTGCAATASRGPPPRSPAPPVRADTAADPSPISPETPPALRVPPYLPVPGPLPQPPAPRVYTPPPAPAPGQFAPPPPPGPVTGFGPGGMAQPPGAPPNPPYPPGGLMR